MKIRITTEVDDDFTPGCCYECPFAYQQEYDDDGYYDYEYQCVLSGPYWECPIEVVKE